MIKEAIGYGESVEEATEQAKAQLGARDDEDIQIDVISMPKKKIMGIFGGSQAEVRVSVERPDEKSAKTKPQKNNNRKEKAKKEPQKHENKPKERKKEELNFVLESELDKNGKPYKAVAYLKSILTQLGCENTTVKVAARDDGAVISLEGENLGVIIGRRGETLDALQHLASLAARDEQGYFKVTLNIGDYREKRESTLSSLAARIAAQVKESGRGKALEPMNPYERRIVHTVIQEIEGVTSASVGEGENRRVVIVPEGQDVHSVRIDRRGGGRNRGGRYDRRGGGRGSRPSNKVQSPQREPRSDSNAFPLYGKIETKK